MNIKRTGPGSPQPINDTSQAQNTERTAAPFKASASKPSDAGAAAGPVGVPPGVTQADLRDSAKLQEIVNRCFSDLVESAGEQLGNPVSDAQKRDVLEFLSNDPVMRGKLIKYLEQVVK